MEFDPASCFVVGPGNFIPPSNDPACKECIGLSSVKEAYRRHSESVGEPLPLRMFRRRFIADNEFVGRVRQAQWESWSL